MIKKNILLFCLMLLLLPTFSAYAQTQPLYFAQYPALSPDGSVLVFSYAGDIWRVSASGGTAEKITAMRGIETSPRISPDGEWLVFTSNQFGNNDIYITSMKGGRARRLTFHSAQDKVSSWSWDSKYIYFVSDRYNRISTYKVKVSGGTPQRIFGNYFNTIHGLVEDPVDGNLFFNYSWESSFFATRQGYKGPFNPNIQSYNLRTKVYKKYTNWIGKDFGTTIDQKGNVYFVSDQGNGQMNLYTFENDKKKPLTQFKEMVIHPFVDATGDKIVFEKGYSLWMYDVKDKKAHKIPVTGFLNNTLSEKQDYNIKGNITSYDVSDDNKKIAFVSRGRLFVCDISGKFIKELHTMPEERVVTVHWLADNKTLIYGETFKGYENWFTQSADGKGKEKQITSDSSNNRLMAFDHKKQRAVYLSGRNEVRLLDLKTMQSTTIVKDELWGFNNDRPSFSPDGQYIVYSAVRNFEKDLFVYHIADQNIHNITRTGVTERKPFWSPDGKYLYFISDRTQPEFPYGMQHGHVYRMALKERDKPFRSDKFNDLFKKEKKKKDTAKKDKKHTHKAAIDFNGLMSRVQRVSPGFGQQSDVYVFMKNEKRIVLYTSNHDKGQYRIWKKTSEPFETDKTQELATPSTDGLNIVSASGHYYILLNGSVYKLNTDQNKVDKIDMHSYKFHKDLQQEFHQMFYETWANIEENYYNETFNGVNWKATRDQYAAYLPHVQTRSDYRRLMKDMMGALNTSHYGFTTSGNEERTYYHVTTAEPGILFEKTNPYIVQHIVKKSPADFDDKDILPGDELIAVNDTLVNKRKNREYYFNFPDMPGEMSLTFKREEKKIHVKIHPESAGALKVQLNDEWIADNAKRVDSAGHHRIGYVYMKDMSSAALQKFKEDMVSDSCNRDALILDLRYNTGGNVHDKVLQFLSQHPYLQWKYRGGKMSPQPDFAPAAKPIVLLVNQQTLSDGEMTAAGFKQLKLGTVIGTGTYHWIIFTTGKRLVDGSYYRLPSWGCFTLNGKNLERTGVTPDIYVDNTFKDRLESKDPQIKKAVNLLLSKLK